MTLKEKDKKIPLVKDAFEKYLEEVKSKRKERTYQEYKKLYDKCIAKDLSNYRIDALVRADIAKLHNRLKATPYQANRALALLSAFLSWCEKDGHRADGQNPCRHIDKFKETSRERFLSEAELFTLGKAIARYENDHRFLKEQPHKKDKTGEQQDNISTTFAAAAIRLLLLTGARCNEILTLKWTDVDFENRLIRLQDSKTGKKTIYLSAPALQILHDLPRIEGNPYVICGKNDGAHLVNIKDPWFEIRAHAGMSDVRIHDLRHSYASTAVAGGHHLKVIGSLLGHADTQTTERYAHFANDPLQAANEAIGKKIHEAMTAKPERDNVVGIGSRRK